MALSLWRGNGETYPVLGIRDDVDQLFGDLLGIRSWRGQPSGEAQIFLPAMDIRETANSLVVETELPGIDAKELEIQVVDGVLSIRGNRKREESETNGAWHRIERIYGQFERQVSLPSTVDAEKVEASYTDGVLTVTLPKKEEAKPKMVSVKVK